MKEPRRCRCTDAGERVWVRVERQTLRRLPRTGSVVFGIRTRQRPLGEIGEADRSALRTALRDLPDDMAAYKSITHLRPAVLEWLSHEGSRTNR